MQLRITMQAQNGLDIPLSYNHQVQSALYSKLREVGESDFWHNSGYALGKVFKSFVFGPLLGKYTVKDKRINFWEEISLEIRSPAPAFCDALQRSFELNPSIQLCDIVLDITGIYPGNLHINTDSAVFTAQSPVIAYSTDENKRRYFFGPHDDVFVGMITKNYEHKYSAVTGQSPEEILIEPLGEHRRVATYFKQSRLLGWRGDYRISGSSKALEFIYNTGLGSKNSQGFGLLQQKTEYNTKTPT